MSNLPIPTMADGAVDWNSVFDAPGTGLVESVQHAHSAGELKRSVQLILETLFSRGDEGDAERRAVFANLVNDILTTAQKAQKSPAATIADVKIKIIQVLHRLKEDRIKRAAKTRAARAKAASVDSGADDNVGSHEDRLPDDINITVSGKGSQTPGEDDDVVQSDEDNDVDLSNVTDDVGGASAEEYFDRIIISSVLRNLSALQDASLSNNTVAGKLPFILSPAFAKRFEQVLHDRIVPAFIEASEVTIGKMAAKSSTTWSQYLSDAFADRAQGLMLWERWQMTWLEMTTQQEEPAPPAVDPSKQGFRGVVNRLIGSEDYFIEEEEMTQEEWQDAVEETRSTNIWAQETWSMMIADSDAFHPPVNEDNALLMNLFRGMEKPEVHVSALMQIAENSDTAGRVFDSYAPGKDLDLPLLIACYQAPDTLLRGDRAILSYFLAGFKKKQRQERFPLCCRHLGQFM